jgi:hypothetical protein
MRVLFIGGTGNISAACSRLCLERGMEVFHLNRGLRKRTRPWTATSRPGARPAAPAGEEKDRGETIMKDHSVRVRVRLPAAGFTWLRIEEAP